MSNFVYEGFVMNSRPFVDVKAGSLGLVGAELLGVFLNDTLAGELNAVGIDGVFNLAIHENSDPLSLGDKVNFAGINAEGLSSISSAPGDPGSNGAGVCVAGESGARVDVLLFGGSIGR